MPTFSVSGPALGPGPGGDCSKRAGKDRVRLIEHVWVVRIVQVLQPHHSPESAVPDNVRGDCSEPAARD